MKFYGRRQDAPGAALYSKKEKKRVLEFGIMILSGC